MDVDLLDSGKNYKELPESYVVFLCTFNYFNRGLPRYDFHNTCQQLPDLILEDEAYKIFFNTEAFSFVKNEKIRAVLQYIKGEK